MVTDQTDCPVEFIKLHEVKALTSLGATKIYELIKRESFPRQVPLAGRGVAWVKSEVLAWNRAQVEAARTPTHKTEHIRQSGVDDALSDS